MKLVLDQTAFEPGDTITGRVHHPARVEAIVSLQWETKSFSHRESGRLADVRVVVDDSMFGHFTITTPDTPISFEGKLFSLVMYLHVHGALQEDRVDIVIAPGRVVATYPTP
jgi:hypothetical protein